MKGDYKGIPINKFVGLKSKMHYILSKDDNLLQQNEYILQLSLKNDYALLNKNVMRHKMKRIQNKKHQTETYELNKILFCFDDKRFVLDDGIHMLAYFHKDLKKNKFLQMIIEILKNDHKEEESLTNKN